MPLSTPRRIIQTGREQNGTLVANSTSPNLGYQFDAAGNLIALRNGHQNDPVLRAYGYDGLNRLTSVRDAADVAQGSYGYDKTGNRMASGQLVTTPGQSCVNTPPGQPCTPSGPVSTWTTWSYGYLPNDHHLRTIGNTERRYDAAGNTVWIGPRSLEFAPPPSGDPPPGDPLESAAYSGTEQTGVGLEDGNPAPGIVTRSFVYSAANRMASVSQDGALMMSYRYNGAGERVYRSGSGQTAHTVFDPAGRWIGDYDEYGQLVQQAIWLDDLPVGLLARVAGGQRKLFYLQPDALGTPRVVIDPTRGTQGGAVWRWELESEAFGETAPNEDPDGDSTLFVLDLRYPGQQYDSATGFNYNYFRDYDPATGRYVQSDPIGLRGGINTFSYVKGRPLLFIDKYGLDQILPNVPGNCMSYAMGYEEELPGSGFDFNNPDWPEEFMTQPAFGCRKIDCADSVDCDRRKVVVFVDLGQSDNWHVMRQQCNGKYASKDGDDPPVIDIERSADEYYRDVYSPRSKVQKTCWDCPPPQW